MNTVDEKQLSQQLKKRYSIKNNALSEVVKPDKAELTEIEIGDVKQPDFLPQVKIKKWNNEVNLSIRLIDDDPAIAKITSEEEKVIWGKGEKEARFYPKTIDLQQEIYDEKLEYPKINGKVQFKSDPFPHLIEEGYVWGRDDENERAIRQEAAEKAYGDVLVVGLGLGVINEYLKKNDKVKSITIIEFSQDIIDIVKAKYPERLNGIKIIKQEFYEYSATTEHRYDYVYGDIFTDLRTQYLYQWQRFLDSAYKIASLVDGRIRQSYENFVNRVAIPEEEGLELDVVIKQKPKDNRIDFSLQHKQVDFFYQPKLTEEEIKRGFYRPPSVTGSYAVYHKDKKDDYSKAGGNNYRSGKVGHIYRPIITDAVGNKTYGDLEITEDKLTVIVPEEFLAKAVYPVIVDPTFGYTTAGASGSSSYGGDRVEGSLFTGLAGTGESISAYINKDATVPAKAVIFTHSTLVPLTDAVTEEKTTAKLNGWETYNFTTKPQLTAVDYLVSWYCQGVGKGTLNEFKYDTGATNQGHNSFSVTYGTVPSPLTSVNHDTNKYSIYVTYSEQGPFSPGTMADDSAVGTVAWTNPDNAKVSDNSRASAQGSGSTYQYNFDSTVKLVKGGVVSGTNKQAGYIGTTEAYTTYGSASDLWGNTLTPSDVNASDFGVVFNTTGSFGAYTSHYLKATNFGFAIPTGATIDGVKVEIEKYSDETTNPSYPTVYVDHIRITVYYTLSYGTATSSERSAVIRGKTTANAERAANIKGKTTANSDRAANIKGKTTANSERPATITGKDSSNSDRAGIITGKASTNDDRSAKIAGIDTANSERSARTTGLGLVNSEFDAKITGVAGNVFSKETKATLPSDDANLEPVYTATEVSNVIADDDVYVDLDASITGFAIHKYKIINTNNTDKADITFMGRCSIAPSASNVFLQILNRNSATWETIATESTVGVGVKFTMIASVVTGLADYYDANNIISLRVYQEIT